MQTLKNIKKKEITVSEFVVMAYTVHIYIYPD